MKEKPKWICSIFMLRVNCELRQLNVLFSAIVICVSSNDAAVVYRFFGACRFCLRSEFYYATRLDEFPLATMMGHHIFWCACVRVFLKLTLDAPLFLLAVGM